jgi:hypothetical protein
MAMAESGEGTPARGDRQARELPVASTPKVPLRYFRGGPQEITIPEHSRRQLIQTFRLSPTPRVKGSNGLMGAARVEISTARR